MATPIAALEILMTANRQGLERELRQGFLSVQKWTEAISGQEVDWKAIFTRSISPALISGIAATFAMAISEMMSFQTASAEAAAEGSTAFGNARKEIDSDVNSMRMRTGVGAKDITSAWGAISGALHNTALEFEVVDRAAKLQAMGIGKTRDTAISFAQVLRSWNITDIPGAIEAMDALYSASIDSSFTLSELTSLAEETGTAFRDHISTADAITGLQAFENQAGITKDVAVEEFRAIAKASSDSKDTLGLMVGGIDEVHDTLATGGIAGMIRKIKDEFDGSKMSADALATAMSQSTKAVNQLRGMTDPAMEKFASDAELAATNVTKINDAYEDTATLSRYLSQVWQAINVFLGNFLKSIGENIEKAFSFIKDFGETEVGSAIKNFAGLTADLVKDPLKDLGIIGSGAENSEAGGGFTPSSSIRGDTTINNIFHIDAAPGETGQAADDISDKIYNLGFNE